uniref:Putative secreted protein n=1 Tax=Anopheles marajoara TaxID=58244 RepID=A0A2M4C7F3_9DIPT
MRQQMVFQRETLLALLTLVWSFGRVQQQMRVQTVLVSKVLATVHTDMRTFACVDACVCCEVMLQQEGFTTLIARVRTLLWYHVRRWSSVFLYVIIVINLHRFQLRRNAQRRLNLELMRCGVGL